MTDKKNKNKRKHKWLGFLLTAAVIVLTAVYSLRDDLAVREYTLKSDLAGGNFTYAVITDLHSTFYGAAQEELAAEITKHNPDAVFFVGDIADDSAERQSTGAEVLFANIAWRYPCYYVTGNHERWLDYTDDIYALFGEYGVKSLRCESVPLGDGIMLHGIDDPLFYEDDEEFLACLGGLGVTDEKFDILLSHRPEFAEEYAELGFDLVLAGHAHGGQVRIPLFMNGLYAPNQGWFPEYAGGRYEIGDSTIIVSRGLMLDELPRIFNRPELVIVKVKSGS